MVSEPIIYIIYLFRDRLISYFYLQSGKPKNLLDMYLPVKLVNVRPSLGLQSKSFRRLAYIYNFCGLLTPFLESLFFIDLSLLRSRQERSIALRFRSEKNENPKSAKPLHHFARGPTGNSWFLFWNVLRLITGPFQVFELWRSPYISSNIAGETVHFSLKKNRKWWIRSCYLN